MLCWKQELRRLEERSGIAGGAGSSALPPELFLGQVIPSSPPHHHSQACSFSVTLKNPIFVGKIVLRFFFFHQVHYFREIRILLASLAQIKGLNWYIKCCFCGEKVVIDALFNIRFDCFFYSYSLETKPK